ncbi:MAG: hypothetical protein EPN26_01350 [Rhodospirillales bacterium]|nr:MAG: hypothetical protein EPN26_01350 [Rhodospirillales bacterium]
MNNLRFILPILVALSAALQTAPALAMNNGQRDTGYLTEVDKLAIESMQSLMGDRPDAQYAIGKIYLRGGLERDAKSWIGKSAGAGYPQARMWVAEQKMKAEFKGRQGRMLAASRRVMAKGGE